MTKWQEVKLAELATIKYGKNQKDVAIEISNIPIYGTGGIMGYASKALYDKPSVLIGRKGTIDKVRYVTKPFWAVDTTFYTIINENKILPRYFYYLLSLVDLSSYNEGTTIPSLRTETLNRLEFMVPPLDIQKKIVGVLGALDDKIELNNRINNNLEQQAQALFKSWFVDIKETSQSNEKFGYIPQNATVKKVGELPVFITDYVANGSFASLKENVTLYQNKNYAYFIRNTDLKSNSFEVYVDEHSYKFLSKSSLFGNEIIISNVGDVGSVFLCPKLDLPMTLGNNIIMLRAETDSYLDFYLYIWFKWSYGQELIQGIKGGSAQPKFNKTDFKGLPVILPSQQQLKEFNAAVTPVFNKISQNNQENIRLVQLRDTLLPKLMSGEIDVSNVDISALTSTDKLSFM